MNSIPVRLQFSIFVAFWLASFSNFGSVSAQELNWQTDIGKAIELAEKEQKLVLLHFTATWSRSCQDLDTFVYSSPHVRRAIDSNVIPVRIDVDEQVELTSQYGIGKVPYDVVITTSKRIVARRECPRDSVNYSSMILRLERVIQQMAQQGNSTFDQNLDEFQQLTQKTEPIREHKSIEPDSPSHSAPTASQDSQELNRKYVTNATSSTKSASSASSASEAKQATAEFQRSSGSQSAASKPNTASPNSLGPLKIINPNFFASSDKSNSIRPTNAIMKPNLQRPPALVESSGHQARPQSIDQAKFVGNATAVATGFKTNAPTESGFRASSELIAPAESRAAPAAATAKSGSKFSIENGAHSAASGSGVSASAMMTTEKPLEKILVVPSIAAAEPSAALQGKCPVTLIREGRWTAGDKRWGCVHRERTYFFSSQGNLSAFLTDPDAYSPLLAGFDPVVFERTGKLVPGLEEHGVFMGKAPNLRVVLFSGKDTRSEFESNPKKFVLAIRDAMENSGGGSSPVEH